MHPVVKIKDMKWPVGRVSTAVGITVLAFLISFAVAYDISSISYFAPMEKASDFRISDFYQIVADGRGVRELDRRIVVVAIDDCSREEIAEVVEQVDFCAPRAVGLDVFFDYPMGESDERLVGAIRACERLVLPLDLRYEAEADRFASGKGSFFYDRVSSAEFGAVNLAGSDTRSAIREFRPLFPRAQDTVLNFVAVLARQADPAAFGRLAARGNVYETIAYPSREFEVVEAGEVLACRELLHDRIVLIGTVRDLHDRHMTPTDARMPGVLLHAHALSTILRGDYIRETGNGFDWTVAIALCFLMVLADVLLRDKNVGELVIRLLQLLLLYLVVLCGCHLFISHRICINFAKPLLMVALGLLASDIWFGMVGAGEWFRKMWRRKFKSI